MSLKKLCYTMLFSIILYSPAYCENITSHRGFKCTYTDLVFTTLQGDNFKIKTQKQNQDVVFSNLNYKAGIGKIIGNVGSAEVAIFVGMNGSVTLMENVPSGNVSLTTIFDSMDTSGSYPCVNSRHVTLGIVYDPTEKSSPVAISQQFGKCSPLD